MKYFIIILFLLSLSNRVKAQGTDLDISNYELWYEDNFDYSGAYSLSGSALIASTAPALSGTVVGQPISANWIIGEYDGWKGFHADMRSNNVKLISPGILKLSEKYLPSSDWYWTLVGGDMVLINHESGRVTSRETFGYGVIQARVLLAPDPSVGSYSAWSAFWQITDASRHNEIDIFDVSRQHWLVSGMIDWSSHCSTVESRSVNSDVPFHGITDLGHIESEESPEWHEYTCVWTPEKVRLYLDGWLYHTIDYSTVRGYSIGDVYPWSFALLVDDFALDGYSMYIDWFRLYKQKCNPEELTNDDILTVTGTSQTFVNPGLHKAKNITIGEPIISGPSYLPITRDNDPIILEAEGTTIVPNFLADQSTLFDGDCGYQNGFFEIKAIDCDVQSSNYYKHNNNSNTFRQDRISDDVNAYNSVLGKRRVEANNSSILPIDVNVLRQNHALSTPIKHGQNLINTNATKFEVYPNPAQDAINITYPCQQGGPLDINIKDVSGRVMHNETILCSEGTNMQQSIDIGYLSPGVYFVELTLNGEHTVRKIVKM